MEGRKYNLFCEFCMEITEQIVKHEEDHKQNIICQKCKNEIKEFRLDNLTNLRKEVFTNWPKKLQEEIQKEMNQKKNGN